MFAALHDDEHLTRYEQLIEAAIDLDKVPDEYLISPEYNSGLEVGCTTRGSFGYSCEERLHALSSFYTTLKFWKLEANPVYCLGACKEIIPMELEINTIGYRNYAVRKKKQKRTLMPFSKMLQMILV